MDAPALEIRTVDAVDELAELDGLFAGIWGAAGTQVAMPVNLLRAIAHAGGYVAGAWIDGSLVGAGVGFLAERGGVRELHSHVVGVARSVQGQGVGYALKLHQRDWSLERAIGRITWTYDPLVRANAWFNLSKLGATAVAYYPNFYGSMVDELNGIDETDRCLVEWDLARTLPLAATDPDRAPVGPGAVVRAGRPTRSLLSESPDGQPVATRVTEDLAANDLDCLLACQVPPDAVAIRRSDPERARAWRHALRETMGAVMQAGFVATAISADGWYTLERRGQKRHRQE